MTVHSGVMRTAIAETIIGDSAKIGATHIRATAAFVRLLAGLLVILPLTKELLYQTQLRATRIVVTLLLCRLKLEGIDPPEVRASRFTVRRLSGFSSEIVLVLD